jgi:hypothetical protein
MPNSGAKRLNYRYYKNCTVTQQVTEARPAVQSTTTVLALYTHTHTHTKLDTHVTGRQTCLLLPMLTSKRWTCLHQRSQEHVTMSLVHRVFDQLRSNWHTPVLAQHQPTAVHDPQILFQFTTLWFLCTYSHSLILQSVPRNIFLGLSLSNLERHS